MPRLGHTVKSKNPGFWTIKGAAPDGSEREFRIPTRTVDHLQRYGPESRYYELISAEQVLKNPDLIYEGLRREGQENGLCYIGKPKCFREGAEYPGHPGMLFLVFVTKEYIIFEWRWEKVDEKLPDYPQDVKQRFETLKCKR
jgi:hypothetical protein